MRGRVAYPASTSCGAIARASAMRSARNTACAPSGLSIALRSASIMSGWSSPPTITIMSLIVPPPVSSCRRNASTLRRALSSPPVSTSTRRTFWPSRWLAAAMPSSSGAMAKLTCPAGTSSPARLSAKTGTCRRDGSASTAATSSRPSGPTT